MSQDKGQAVMWQAVTAHHAPLTSVLARSPDDAREKLEEQLARPSRRQFLAMWEAGGRKVRRR